MKKVLVFTIIFVLLVLLAIWSPWLSWRIDLASIFGVNRPDSISGLQVSSLSDEIEIFIDNKPIGKVTRESSPFIVDRVEPGERLVTLKKTGEFSSNYSNLNKLITFEENSSVVMAYSLGPDEAFSEGHVIYTTQKDSISAKSKLNVNVNVDEFNFTYDGLPPERILGRSISLDLDLNSQHKIKISKTGYESLEFTILPETQEDRDKFKNFDLNIDVNLMLQPVEVEVK